MSEIKPRGLLGYMKEKTALPGEDTNVAILKAA